MGAKNGIHAASYVLFQYDPEVKEVSLNVHFSPARAVQCFLILPLANSPRLSGKLPHPEYCAMAVLPQKLSFPSRNWQYRERPQRASPKQPSMSQMQKSALASAYLAMQLVQIIVTRNFLAKYRMIEVNQANKSIGYYWLAASPPAVVSASPAGIPCSGPGGSGASVNG